MPRSVGQKVGCNRKPHAARMFTMLNRQNSAFLRFGVVVLNERCDLTFFPSENFTGCIGNSCIAAFRAGVVRGQCLNGINDLIVTHRFFPSQTHRLLS